MAATHKAGYDVLLHHIRTQSYMGCVVFLYLPLQNVVPSPVYPWLQKQASFDPFRDLHVASLLQKPQMSEKLHGSIRLESHAAQTHTKHRECEFNVYHSKP